MKQRPRIYYSDALTGTSARLLTLCVNHHSGLPWSIGIQILLLEYFLEVHPGITNQGSAVTEVE